MPISDAQKKASAKYLEKLDEVRIRMPKGKKDNIRAAATGAGESMNQYIINAIDQRMERDASQKAAEAPTTPAEAKGVSQHQEEGKPVPAAPEDRTEGINPTTGDTLQEG